MVSSLRSPLLFVFALVLLFPSCAGKETAPANLLLITVDTLRADRLGCYGGTDARTPAIDRLARGGTLFTNAFCSIPITLPSHASIFTGLYPRTHKVLSHGYTLAPEHTTLAEVLREHGYQTGAFISSHVLDDKYGLAQGFDIYWKRYNYGRERAERLMEEAGEDLLTLAVLDWLRLEAKEPFFIWLHWFHPHKPYEPPGAMRALHDPSPDSPLQPDVPTLQKVWEGAIDLPDEEVERFRSLYAGEVAFTDQQVGIVLSRLKDLGLLENTLVVLTADHGEVLYEHDRYFGHDIMLYEPSLQVPLILSGPGIAREERILDATVRNIDLFPTILDLLGIPSDPSAIEGRSFAAALQEQPMEDAPVFAEVFPPKEVWKTEPRHTVRFGDWKLITKDGTDVSELFDLSDDPAEKQNRSEDAIEKRAEMERLLREWIAAREGTAPEGYPELTEQERENLKSLGYITE
ncbi:MAG: sulfatase [Candidatus Eisenbacteria bacterium]|nr:sulfatase [Candidatus Eisenbacteria bacterium]